MSDLLDNLKNADPYANPDYACDLIAEVVDEIERLRAALFQIAHQRYGDAFNAIDNYNALQAVARAALATGVKDE